MSARLAVLVSGSGTNLQAMIAARAAGELAATIVLVVSNRPEAKAIERAKAAGLETLVLDHTTFATRAAFDEALDAALTARKVELVALAGFMRLLTPWFVARWRGRLVNVHPSLLPEFRGAHAIHDAIEAKAARTGVSIHFVDEGTDSGPIIVQAALDVLPGDTEATLAERIHAIEHQLYPAAIAHVARGDVKLEGREVIGTVLWTPDDESKKAEEQGDF